MPVDQLQVNEQLKTLSTFSQFGTKKEIAALPEILNTQETIHALGSGMMDNHKWIIVVTDQRILFLDKGMVYGLKQKEIPINTISGISHEVGMLFGSITIGSAATTSKLTQVEKALTAPLAKTLSEVVQASQGSPKASESTNENDVVSQLERLAALKEKGILNDEEFQTQKAKILA